MRKPVLLFCLALVLLPVAPAQAYVGPGVGAGTIAIVLGILSSIFLAFVGIIWYPIKRLIKGRKASKAAPVESGGPARDTSSQSEPGRS